MPAFDFVLIMLVLFWFAGMVWWWPLRRMRKQPGWVKVLKPDPTMYVFVVTSPEHAKRLFGGIHNGAYETCLETCLAEFKDSPAYGFIVMVEYDPASPMRQWWLIRLCNGECIRTGIAGS